MESTKTPMRGSRLGNRLEGSGSIKGWHKVAENKEKRNTTWSCKTNGGKLWIERGREPSGCIFEKEGRTCHCDDLCTACPKRPSPVYNPIHAISRFLICLAAVTLLNSKQLQGCKNSYLNLSQKTEDKKKTQRAAVANWSKINMIGLRWPCQSKNKTPAADIVISPPENISVEGRTGRMWKWFESPTIHQAAWGEGFGQLESSPKLVCMQMSLYYSILIYITNIST